MFFFQVRFFRVHTFLIQFIPGGFLMTYELPVRRLSRLPNLVEVRCHRKVMTLDRIIPLWR